MEESELNTLGFIRTTMLELQHGSMLALAL